MAEKRNKIWIDRLQTTLSIRLASYFVIFQFTVWFLSLVERSMSEPMGRMFGPEWRVYNFIFTAVPAVVLGFLFIWDAVRMMHRVVGPLVRFRQVINAITAGEEVRLVVLRKGDHLQDLKEDFNKMLEALEQRGALVVTPAQVGKVEKSTVTV